MRSLIKKLIPHSLFWHIEPYGHLVEAVIEQTLAGFPARSLKVIGVTGTDGKTTTSTLITHMLRSAGYKVAMMTTISLDLGDGNGVVANTSRLTTMGSRQLISNLKKVRDAQVDYLVLEVTSHALAQHRVWGIPFSIAVWTNLNHEHLDYHKTFENYRRAKVRLFELAARHKGGLRAGVVNSDDPSEPYFSAPVPNVVRYGINSGTLRATHITTTPQGSSYRVRIAGSDTKIVCNLPGRFNVLNSLAAIGVGELVGLSATQITKGIASLDLVEGRMARIDEGQDFELIIDYAHTPESFEKIFSEIKPAKNGRLIVVFGSAGRRDQSKRARQGEIAGKAADIVIVTEEDDRDIDGHQILEQIAEGAIKAGKSKDSNLLLIHDRTEAVAKAVALARPNDVVLLLGKGHESSIISNKPGVLNSEQDNYDEATMTISRPYSEETAARDALRARLSKRSSQ